uniref:Protein jagunal n=1 Tax=Meloidogyne incognita TaxID=6306 RepID=A0A914KX39_MELIC
MSSTGARAVGTDGTDFKHRQRVAASIKLSVQYKFYLKLLFALHFLILLPLWAKVGGELIFDQFKLMKQPKLWRRMDLPNAYPWEYIWCLSFIPIILAIPSFQKNRLLLLKLSYYSQFLFGITPCAIGLGSQFPELIDYIRFGEQSKVPTFSGSFPMVILWYLFFLAVFQIQGFSMYFTFNLLNAWRRDPIILKQSADKTQNIDKKDE